MGKSEIHWAIFSGKALMPFSIRTTKNQCVTEFIRGRRRDSLLDHESCKKVVINEFISPNSNR